MKNVFLVFKSDLTKLTSSFPTFSIDLTKLTSSLMYFLVKSTGFSCLSIKCLFVFRSSYSKSYYLLNNYANIYIHLVQYLIGKMDFDSHLIYLKETDFKIYEIILKETERQGNVLELMPSENTVSAAIMEAQGSVLTNKYSDGYPGRRYYGGNRFIDEIETLAIERAKKLFRAEHANVQPLSGAVMNIATYFALLEPGDTILGMDLGHGGHLTHGHPVTHTYKVFKFVRYKTNPQTGEIDFENLMQMALKYKPKLILAGFSAYTKTLVFGGTENHMILVDLRPTGIRGKEAESKLDECGLCMNKNAIPNDDTSPMNPNGIRMGTPTITIRRLKEDDCYLIGKLIAKVIKNIDDENVHKEVRTEVGKLTEKYSLYKS